MKRGLVNAVIVGADRIAANGDVANKIGTYALAVNARHHEIPFYVAAPTSTIDLSTKAGKDIPIEQRDPREVTSFFDNLNISESVEVYSPAFDITPNDLVSAFITEGGVLQKPFSESLRIALVRKKQESTVGALS
jgi:methylthioribose-1-phosphate isomerase